MINSLRRVSLALLVVGVVGLGGSFAITNPRCSLWCSASVAFVPLALNANLAVGSNSGSTMNVSGSESPELLVTKEVLQVLSAYALFLAVLMLIALEIREIHYLKLLVPRHHR